jgi:Transposase.
MLWKSPNSQRTKKGHMSHSEFKAMLIVFLDIQGVVVAECVPGGQTVSQHYYIEILVKLHE